VKFIWDARKATSNLRKHRISFDEAATTFGDPFAITIADPDHSFAENRLLTIGVSSSGETLVVSHTELDDAIRIISARRATNHERKQYEG